MENRNAVVLGCGAVLLMAVVMIAAAVLFLMHVSTDVEGVTITADSPTEVVVGQTFELKVTVKNDRSGKVLHLSDLDIAEEYLAGFSLSSTDPTPKSNSHVPLVTSRSFTFNLPISAGTTQSFVFTLRAERPGFFRGDVDACEGMRTITAMAQTVVKAKE